MKREEQSETGNLPRQTDQQDGRGIIAVSVGNDYYGLLPHHFMCTANKSGQNVRDCEIPHIARKYCGGCGRSLLPYPESFHIEISDKIIRGLQTDRRFFGYVHEIAQHKGFGGVSFEDVRVHWVQTKKLEWVRADELMLFDEWEKEHPMPNLRDFWSASTEEQTSLRRSAGIIG